MLAASHRTLHSCIPTIAWCKSLNIQDLKHASLGVSDFSLLALEGPFLQMFQLDDGL
jgi:hypothetical protein